MKKLTLVLTLCLSLQAEFLQEDKKKHAAVGTAIYYSCVGLGKLYMKHDFDLLNRSMCWTINLGIAGLKEWHDSKNGGVADFNDIAAQVFVPSIDVTVWSWGGESSK